MLLTIALAAVVAALPPFPSGALKPQSDLAFNAPLRIGVLHRAAPTATGAEPRCAATGDKLSVQFAGWLRSTGAPFREKGQPFDFVLGDRRVLPGWNRGLLGMCVGERRKLVLAITPPCTLTHNNRNLHQKSEVVT